MIKISSIQQLRLTIILLTTLFLGFLVWTLMDPNATCKVLVVSEKTEAISFKHGTQQQAQIISISLNSPLQKLFLKNTGTSKIYRSDLIVFVLAFFIFAGIQSYFQIYTNANPFHKTVDNLVRAIFIFLSLYLLCRCLFFIDSYNAFIDARLPKGLQQYQPHDTGFLLFFFLLPIMEIYKFMVEKGKKYQEEIDIAV